MTERIDHSNYEAWLLDRLEGALSPEQERALTAFLLLHPELDPGAEELPTVHGLSTKLDALDKEALKKRLPPAGLVHDHNVDDHLIARLENDLTVDQLEALRVFLIQHPEHQRAERVFALTKLVPMAMAFAEKKGLERVLPPLGMPAPHTLDDFLVAKLEGELSAAQEAALDVYLRGEAGGMRSWELMQATKVMADTIAFPAKDELKKGGRVIAIGSNAWVARLAAAASIAVLLGMAWRWSRTTAPGEQVADGQEMISRPKGEGSPAAEKDTVTQEEVSSPDTMPRPEEGVKQGPNRRVPAEKGVVREPRPVPEREAPLPVAEQRNGTPVDEPRTPTPRPLPIPEALEPPNETLVASVAEPAHSTQRGEANTLGHALAATVRERVLDQPATDAGPLNGDDAVAAVDKGLKAVGGGRAGLSVARDEKGRSQGFNLRLGRNLAISASR